MSQDTSHSVRTSHALGSHSIQTEILNFPVNHILQVSCDRILCCDWYALHGAGRQVALWPYPRPFPSVRNRVWPREIRYINGSQMKLWVLTIWSTPKMTMFSYLLRSTYDTGRMIINHQTGSVGINIQLMIYAVLLWNSDQGQYVSKRDCPGLQFPIIYHQLVSTSQYIYIDR